jgi:hypothetical protein
MFTADEDIGIELCSDAPSEPGQWHCWLRSDFAYKYNRFIHIRHLRFQHELIAIIVALSGVPWNPERHLYGAIRNRKTAEYLIKSEVRLDRDHHKAPGVVRTRGGRKQAKA